MTDGIDVGAIDRRARTAGYSDGLLEIFAAVVLLVLAWGWVTDPGFVGIFAAFIVLFGWKALERVKEKVTYPRIGYHREREPREPKAMTRGMLLFIGGAFLLMAVVVLISGGLTDSSEWRRAAPLVSGISLAGGFWYTGSQSALIRYRLMAGWSLVSGVLLWWFGAGETYSAVVWHLLGLAIPLGAVGVWSMLHFIRTHPIQTDG